VDLAEHPAADQNILEVLAIDDAEKVRRSAHKALQDKGLMDKTTTSRLNDAWNHKPTTRLTNQQLLLMKAMDKQKLAEESVAEPKDDDKTKWSSICLMGGAALMGGLLSKALETSTGVRVSESASEGITEEIVEAIENTAK
jgi:hypothetical protein